MPIYTNNTSQLSFESKGRTQTQLTLRGLILSIFYPLTSSILGKMFISSFFCWDWQKGGLLGLYSKYKEIAMSARSQTSSQLVRICCQWFQRGNPKLSGHRTNFHFLYLIQSWARKHSGIFDSCLYIFFIFLVSCISKSRFTKEEMFLNPKQKLPSENHIIVFYIYVFSDKANRQCILKDPFLPHSHSYSSKTFLIFI